MKHSKITGLFALCLLGAVACTKKEPERAMTPASAPITPSSSEMAHEPGSATQPWKQIPEHEPAPTAGQSAIADNDKSSKLIAMGRCEREQRCNNVGQEGEYITQEDCVVSLEPGTRSEIDARNCPGGIQEVELAECVEEIKNADCNNPMQNLELVAACRTEELCLD